MVRLEVDEQLSISTLDPKFQFLYGAIGSNFADLIACPGSCFNSYMVRLEALHAYIFAIHDNSFNSYMVRLEVEWRLKNDVPVSFQFLYGAIGSLCLPMPYTLNLVSIPIWCDWKFINASQLR